MKTLRPVRTIAAGSFHGPVHGESISPTNRLGGVDLIPCRLTDSAQSSVVNGDRDHPAGPSPGTCIGRDHRDCVRPRVLFFAFLFLVLLKQETHS